MASADERLATLEERISGVRGDLAELTAELGRARTRLHNLEGIASTFVETQKLNRQREAEQYRRLGIRIQVLTLVIGAAAVVVPIVTILLTGK